MIELTTTVFMTSRDAFEIADKLQRLERTLQTSKSGDNLIVDERLVNSSNGLIVRVRFCVDQERSQKAGFVSKDVWRQTMTKVDWQPIETAPKNEFVLVACRSGYTTIAWVYRVATCDHGYVHHPWRDEGNCGLSDDCHIPEFWAELPDEPAILDVG